MWPVGDISFSFLFIFDVFIKILSLHLMLHHFMNFLFSVVPTFALYHYVICIGNMESNLLENLNLDRLATCDIVSFCHFAL